MGTRDSQPGLEVVEVSHHDSHPPPAYFHRNDSAPGLEVSSHSKDGLMPISRTASKELPPPPLAAADSAQRARRRRRRFILIGVVVGVVVIIAVVVGGVLGSRAANKSKSTSSSDTAPQNGSGSNTTTSSPASIDKKSRIAVTGWREGSAYSVRLFYQGQDDVVRMLNYSSATGQWSAPLALSSVPAKKESPLAAGTYLGNQPPYITLFYTTADSTLQGQVFQSGSTPPTGQPADWLNPLGLRGPSTDGAHLSSYWPYVSFQPISVPGSTSPPPSVQWLTCIVPGPNCLSANQSLPSVRAAPAAGSAVLPTAVRYLDAGGLVYVAPGSGSLTKFLTTTDDAPVQGWSWTPGSLGVTVPASAPVGAFVYGAGGTSSSNTSDLINTYVLYQAQTAAAPGAGPATADILVVHQNAQGPWRGPASDEALADADLGTDIACLTQQAWDGVGVNLSSQTDMNLCWFQAGGGKLKEVWFDGADWHDRGFLQLS